MDNRGPFTFGDVPDDADGPDEEDAVHQGWIAPEDRLWKHPSEISGLGHGVHATATALERASARDVWHERRGAIAAGTLGAAAVAAAAALVLTLTETPATTTATRRSQPAVTSLVTIPSVSIAAPSGIMQLISTLRPSLVELEPTGSTRGATLTGVVLPGGQFVVTAASAAAGVSRMEVVTSNGRHLSGKVVATDKGSGVAVVRTSGGLKPAPFADDDVVPGELAVTACLHRGTQSSAPNVYVAVGTVQQVGRQVPSGEGAGLMDAIEAETPIRADWGGVLMDGHGQVIGILDGQENTTTGTIGLFVPGSLALGVADELASNDRIEHGWMGVAAEDAPDNAGAVVTNVFQNSPAAGAGIVPGDVVTAIGSHSVSSHADLEARLYTVAPGSTVELTVQRSGATWTVSMALAADPGG
ncbi:MAG: PDZ domain-containing protein [Acidimicrobiales bacterium]|jgi:putative serine protease PepD